ncbi:hypothetical protein F5B20DRAFT_156914 [Whalleya microplaca]|nr:hypothetical protein F5B20DRAFT_156914 [Whalleya microplaca]
MKLQTALSTLTFSVWALAAPIATRTGASIPVLQTPSRSKIQHLTPSKASIAAHSDFQGAINNQRVQLPDNAASPDSWQTPHILSFISSLTRRPKTSTPFAESTIMGEETRASRVDTEPQETIVELETKAERESWTYLPYLSAEGVLCFHRVRNTPDIVVVSIVLSSMSTLLLWQLWRLVQLRVRSYRSGSKKGVIRLQDEEKATLPRELSVQCESLVLQPAPVLKSTSSTLDEKGVQI